MNYQTLATPETITKLKPALAERNIELHSVATKAAALEAIKALIPAGASVMNGSSTTLNEIGYTDYLKSGEHGWVDLHARVGAEQDAAKRALLRKQTATADFFLCSVHAVTEDGQLVIASGTGSQLPSITFSSPNVIFVVGAQKVVPTLDEAMKRLEEYVYPLEDARMKAAYGKGSTMGKVLIFKKENPVIGRKIHLILVSESLGF